MKNLQQRQKKMRMARAIKDVSRCLYAPYQHWYLVRLMGQGNYHIISDRGYNLSIGLFTYHEVQMVCKFLKVKYNCLMEYCGMSVVELLTH